MSKFNFFKKIFLFIKLKRFLRFSKVKLNYSLKKLTSFKIGGKVDILVTPTCLEDIFKCYKVLTRKNIPFFILGNGTNILASSKGFKGVIIKLSNDFSHIYKMGNSLRVESGASLNKVIAFARDNNLKGLEEGFGIPGTVGGAVFMNASSFSYSTQNVVTSVLAIVNGKVTILSNEDCKFSYRNSIFQSLENSLILYVEFKLTKGNKDEINKKMLEVINLRKLKQPSSFNAGSIFKQKEDINVSKLIDDNNFKGFTIGGAKVSEKHANFIENNNNATSKDVSKLIKTIQEDIYNKHKFKLETEIKFIGEKNGFWWLSYT